MTTTYLIKLAPEITIKSPGVRKITIDLLKRNIKTTLTNEWFDVKLRSNWDSIDLNVFWEFDKEKINYFLKNIFWINAFLEIQRFEFETKEDIAKIVLDYYIDKIPNKSFFVRAKRVWTHDFTSVELERYLWGELLKATNNSSVSLKDPDFLIKLEVKHNILNLVVEYHKWSNWYPIWFTWKALSLLSGWFDSSVATYMSMKRWLKVDYLFFDLWFKPHEIAVKQIAYYLWKNFWQSYKSNFIKIDFSFLINLLIEHAEPKYRSVLLKRYMLKTTDLINPYLQETYNFFKEPYQAVIKWDSVAQVSSQTLANLKTIDDACKMLVLRPLIMFDKEDIINISRNIWAYDFSLSMPEYCSVVSQNPSTKSSLEEIEVFEKVIDEHFYKEILNNVELTRITEVLNFKEKNLEINIVWEIKENDILIDIREKDKISKNPVDFWVKALEIPFFDINSKFEKLDQSKNYLFYCEKWVLSKLHYLYLKDKWFNNISVFRPE